MDARAQYVRMARQSSSLEELLLAPVSVLHGVTEAGAEFLSRLDIPIDSVLDLATSSHFNTAKDIVAQADDPDSVLTLHDALSGALFDTSSAIDVNAVATASIELLNGISGADATGFKDHLGIVNIHTMANWPAFIGSTSLLQQKHIGGKQHIDAGVPVELVPQYNKFATEQTHFTIYAQDYKAGVIDDSVKRLDLTQTAVDLTTDCSAAITLTPTTGARMHIEQTWLPTGLALGTLQYALGLAPGESTRMAVIDWARAQSARSDTQIDESSNLSSDFIHNRAISEVASAIASEAQSGFSAVRSSAATSSSSTTRFGVNNPLQAAAAGTAGALGGAQIGGFVGGIGGLAVGGIAGAAAAGVGAAPGMAIGAVAGTLGGTIVGGAVGGVGAFLAVADFGASQVNTSTNTMSTLNSSFSLGSRSMGAAVEQKVSDTTHQVASSVRNRRASVVQEIDHSEKTNINTRVVANYNHMHALTIEYFEVLQMNEVRASLTDVERLLYVPFSPIEEWSDEVLEKYLPYLLNAARNVDLVFALLYEYETTVMQSQLIARLPDHAVDEVNLRRHEEMQQVNSRLGLTVAERYMEPWVLPMPLNILALTINVDLTWIPEDIPYISEVRVILTNGHVVYIDASAAVHEAYLGDIPVIQEISHIEYVLRTARPVDIPAIPMNCVIHLTTPDREDTLSKRVDISDITEYVADGELHVPAMSFYHTPSEEWTKKHLTLNALYYTRHILGSLDDQQMADLLSHYQYEGSALLSLIEGAAIGFSGNHLVFKHPFKSFQDDSGRQFSASDIKRDWLKTLDFELDHRGELIRQTISLDTIPMPTGGIFAEAVQGRAIAAEKMDITRFWDWKSSPMGKTAPEIAAINEVNRRGTLDAKAGTLPTSLINIQNGPASPDPALQTRLNAAFTNGDLFADITRLEEASLLAQAALNQVNSAATTAGDQSTATLKTGLDQTSELIEKVLTTAGTLGKKITSSGLSLASGGLTKAGDPSVIGSLLNFSRELDGSGNAGAGGAAGSKSASTTSSSKNTNAGLELAAAELAKAGDPTQIGGLLNFSRGLDSAGSNSNGQSATSGFESVAEQTFNDVVNAISNNPLGVTPPGFSTPLDQIEQALVRMVEHALDNDLISAFLDLFATLDTTIEALLTLVEHESVTLRDRLVKALLGVVARPMTALEIETARKVYENSLDYDLIFISRPGIATDIIFGIQDFYTEQFVSPSRFRKVDCEIISREFAFLYIHHDYDDGVLGNAILIHELCHLWQAEGNGFYFMDAIRANMTGAEDGGGYNYGFPDTTAGWKNGEGAQGKLISSLNAAGGDAARAFASFNVEQQAQIIQHYYVRKHEDAVDTTAWNPYRQVVTVAPTR